MGLMLEMLKDELVSGNYLYEEDHVVEVDPYVSIYEANHAEKFRGWAVEVVASDDGEQLLSFFTTQREAHAAARRILERTDFPIFAIIENDLYAVRRVRGIKDEDGKIMTLEHPSAFLRLKNGHRFRS